MDRNTIIRWVVIAAVILIFWKWGLPLITGKSGGDTRQAVPFPTYVYAPNFQPDVVDPKKPDDPDLGHPWPQPEEGELCSIRGNRFRAELSSRGAAMRHFWLTDARYAGTEADDMSTTPNVERWRNLRSQFRDTGADDQIKYDRFLWKVKQIGEPNFETGCEFSYADETVEIKKTILAGERPYELAVETKVTNLSDGTKRHRMSIGVFAYRLNKDTKGKLGRVSPFQTELSCARGKDVQRKSKDDFKTGWYSEPLVDRYVAVSNYYFAQALVPKDVAAGEASDKPECALLAEQIYGDTQKPDDDEAGDVYHALMTYPARSLEHGETAMYRETAYFGPKERDILDKAAGGRGLGDLINLGFFSPVAKVLVGIIKWIHSHITFENWGVAIIVMTIGLRTMLFPLTWKSIKTTVAMRRLKPEIDALNQKFKDDAQAKNLAMMELWRKHKVNPLGGCLPAVVQMPVWFAMYTTLQTAVEFFHTRFLWFTDLSAPDRFYILPFVLGAFMILQQRIVPQQGMDPMQQKMMMWLLPGIFTVMMLFLPAALGVYMLTNSILGIAQQLAVEKFAPRGGNKPPSPPAVVVKSVEEGRAKRAPAMLGKGKARV